MKKLILLGFISILALLVAACGNSDSDAGVEGSSGESSSDKLTIGTTQTEDSHYGAFLKTFKEKVEADSNGEVTVQVHYNSEIGNERDMLESVQVGSLDGTFISTGVISNFVKEFYILDFPFLFDNVEHARTTLSGEVGDVLNEKLEENGIVNLAFAENGFRHITNSTRPIQTPEDLEGVKIRTMEVPLHQEVFSAFGASPTPMAWGEVFTSLQQGVIDAQENPIAIIHSSKLEEVQQYASLSGHVYSPAVLLVGKSTIEKFSDDHQEIIREAAEEAKQANFKFIDENEATQIEELKSKGMEINEVDVAAFQAAAQPIIDKHKGEYEELYNKIKEGAN
ncbi:DctP family TRAP transporter solute-binding subunit [Planococcus sp. CAU13]|uniref:DctP family TRAP transporter solute-binding subunit n=1 Tax=Planococcus sp. CAU13 TaxID=1541197 RepID=UPI00068CF492|nr:DctP family TRAP transporter solute-binding subunit [Planococcus sp. CAU13]